MTVNDKIVELVLDLAPKLDKKEVELQARVLVRKCLNYTNQPELPEDLVEPVAENLALSMLDDKEEHGPLKSVKEGGVTLEFGGSRRASVEGAFLSLKSQLKAFRRVGVLR